MSLHTCSAAALARLDTLYGFARITWNPELVSIISQAIDTVSTPGTRNLQAQIDAFIASADPVEQARLQTLPYHDLRQEMGEKSENIQKMPEIVIEVAGRHFSLTPYSRRRGCNFTMVAAGVSVHGNLCPARPTMPNIYLEIGSEPFWIQDDWKSYVFNWTSWLREISLEKSEWQVTRADLAFHTQAFSSADLDRKRFSCRADKRRTYTKAEFLAALEKAQEKDNYARETGSEAVCVDALIDYLHKAPGILAVDCFHGERAQMITFGTRGRLYCRIYDKTGEIARKPNKKAVFCEVYKQAGFDRKKRVFNVEFEICRSWLQSRDFKIDGKSVIINTFSELLAHYDALCAYFIGSKSQEGWIRMIDQNATRKTRCSTSEKWEMIKEAVQYLPHVSAKNRMRQAVRYSLPHHAPHLARLVARMDAELGREFDFEQEITQQSILERIADLLAHHYNAEPDEYGEAPVSPLALVHCYRAERIRLVHGISELGRTA